MKQLTYFIFLFLLFHKNGVTQKKDLEYTIWKQEVEKVVFKTITDFDQDSTRFIEVFLVFQVRQNTQPLIHTFLVSQSGILDSSLNKPERLYGTSFFENIVLQKLSSSQTGTYFIQPLLFGRTREIDRHVIDPEFYTITNVPTGAFFEKNADLKTLIVSKQLNYIYTVGR
ncbi:hypothetical protein [Lacibacter sp. H407]|uniref:hypothetical protein n=1 Tax=Lacibacter sp. H407 TaxID=3133423 RepID=UPI0030BD6C64